MSWNIAFILPRRSLHLEPSFRAASRARLSVCWLVALMLTGSLAAWGATPTTTTLTTGTKTVNSRTIITLTAKVAPTTVTQGLVRFYDGKILLGTGQIVTTGTKYTHGAAYLSVELGAGSHALKAVFAGSAAGASSASAVSTVNVGGGTVALTLSSTGTAGNYTLTGQMVANGT